MKRIPFKHWLSFLNDGIWRITEDEVSAKQKRTYNILKISFLAVQQFTEDKIMTRASALTYSTLLSIVPILAILFAIARGFGFDNLIESELRNSIANEQSELIITWIKSYLNHTKNGIFVGVGLIMLLWTILNLTDTIEQTFNYIWQVNKPRTLYRKITDYFSILLLLPLLFVISSGLSIFMSTFLKELDNFKLLAPLFQFAIRLIPYILIWGMFIGLYVFIPNTKVKLKHAIIPGIIAGTAFQAFQYIYIGSQIWVSGYNAIYGSFAAIPMFLLWTQISWTICLVGAELSYLSQNVESFNFGKETANISRRYHDFLCLVIMSEICKRFQQADLPPYTAETLSNEHKIPIRLTKKLLYELQEIQLIQETAADGKDEETSYSPRIDINMITVGLLLKKLDTNGSEAFKIDRAHYNAPWEMLVKARKLYLSNMQEVLLKDL